MIKISSFLCMVVFLSLLAVPISHAGGFETKIVFVPETSESELRSSVREFYKKRFKGFAVADKFISSAMAKIDGYVFDLNTLTRDGWEIKASRRARQDFNGSGEPNYYEWGTEYTLQKKKGWW